MVRAAYRKSVRRTTYCSENLCRQFVLSGPKRSRTSQRALKAHLNLLANEYVVQEFENDRLPLSVLRGLLMRFSDVPPSAFIAHVVQFYVIFLHFAVVQERTYDGRNRFFFIQGDNGLERVASKGGVGNVTIMQDRLFHAMLLLAQCGLVRQFDDGTFALTAAGRKRFREAARTARSLTPAPRQAVSCHGNGVQLGSSGASAGVR